jgi:hypothetical protein
MTRGHPTDAGVERIEEGRLTLAPGFGNPDLEG